MKAIKIVRENAVEIEEQLKRVNGTSFVHAFTTFAEIEHIVTYSELRLGELLYKKDYKGAVVCKTSGDGVAKSYKAQRNATFVKLERRSSDWFIVEIAKRVIDVKGGGPAQLILTKEQDALAIELFRKNWYSVAK